MEATLKDHRISIWTNLGRILGGVRNDLKQAIFVAKQTLVGILGSHPDRAPLLSKLSTNMYLKYQRTEVMDDIWQAILYAKGDTTEPP